MATLYDIDITYLAFIAAMFTHLTGSMLVAVSSWWMCAKRHPTLKPNPSKSTMGKQKTPLQSVKPYRGKGKSKTEHAHPHSHMSVAPAEEQPGRQRAGSKSSASGHTGPSQFRNVDAKDPTFKALKPREFKKDAREIEIARGKLYHEGGEYPTVADVVSDWDSTVHDKKEKETTEDSAKQLTVLNVTRGMSQSSHADGQELPDPTAELSPVTEASAKRTGELRPSAKDIYNKNKKEDEENVKTAQSRREKARGRGKRKPKAKKGAKVSEEGDEILTAQSKRERETNEAAPSTPSSDDEGKTKRARPSKQKAKKMKKKAADDESDGGESATPQKRRKNVVRGSAYQDDVSQKESLWKDDVDQRAASSDSPYSNAAIRDASGNSSILKKRHQHNDGDSSQPDAENRGSTEKESKTRGPSIASVDSRKPDSANQEDVAEAEAMAPPQGTFPDS